jgi:hypothetical protein
VAREPRLHVRGALAVTHEVEDHPSLC